MQIVQITAADAPMELLLEADPSAEKVLAYLVESRCFVAWLDGVVVGVYVVKETAAAVCELMNISGAPSFQRRGIGTALLEHAVIHARESGARCLEVGTATFGYYLAFYQRAGFRVEAIAKNFFLDHYPEPLYENGVQHRDMLRLALDLSARKDF